VRIRQAELEADRPTLVRFLTGNLATHGGESHYDWLYRGNPDGPARAWLLLEDETDDVIGAAAAFPRRMTVRGEDLECWNLGDFAIAPAARSLGPAVALQRACLDEVMSGGIPFAYDHPSCNMMAPYARLGIRATAEVVRYAKLLRVDDKVASIAKVGVVGKGVSALGNLILSFGNRSARAGAGFEARALVGRFDDRFSELWRRLAPRREVVGRRTAEYLNWRYLDNPRSSYEIVTVERQGQLMGYAVYSNKGREAIVVDLYGDPEAVVEDALLAVVIDDLRGTDVQTLSAPVLEQSPLIPALERWGFRPRETSPFVVSTRSGGKWDGLVTEARNWFVTHGDRDV
jgi:GNAT superfamily N-acetyltransferase